MKRKNAFVIAAALLLSTSSLAFAENSNHEGANTSGPELKAAMHEDRMQMHDTIIQNREDFHASMSATREEMKAKFQAQRDTFKTKIAQLKDTKKQTTVINVTDRFATINTKETGRMSQGLTSLSTILNKLGTKSASLKTSGKDTTTTDADIVTAKTAIATAQAAVTAQAAKQYIPKVTDDATLRENVKTTFTQMKTDLETTHKSVQTAKQAVLTVAKDITELSK